MPGANLKCTLRGCYSNKTELLGLLWESHRGGHRERGAAAEESVLSLRLCVDFGAGLRSFLGLRLRLLEVSRNFL